MKKYCLKNLIKKGTKIQTIDKQNIEVEFLGKKQEVVLFTPYGLQANPKNDLLAVTLSPEAIEDDMFCFITDIENRLELENDEIAIGIPSLKTYIKFKNDGTMTMSFKDQLELNFDENGITDSNNNVIEFKATSIQINEVEHLQ